MTFGYDKNGIPVLRPYLALKKRQIFKFLKENLKTIGTVFGIGFIIYSILKDIIWH